MALHPIQCRCGTLRGEVEVSSLAMRAVCYCRDCRTYAHWLGQPQQVLDPLGGTDIVATHSRYVRFTAGQPQLACMSLSPRGLLRWYARCCHTPVANTPRDWKLPYVGLVHAVLSGVKPVEASFPRVQMDVNTGSALGPTPQRGGMGDWARFGLMVMRLGAARVTGSYRKSPFFDASGQPVAPVQVPARTEVDAARAAAR